jgi:hypothetical protein
MQKRVGVISRPSKTEVQEYFDKHPEFFSQRKQFDMRQLVIASKDMTDDLKKAMDNAKSIEEVASWLDTHTVKYARNQVSRTTADLAPELGTKLLNMPKGQLFIIREGERSLLISIADVKDAPVTLEVAAPQIEQFLMNAKSKEAAAAEIARLRAAAKIEYLGKAAPQQAAPAAASAPTPAASAAADANAHGAADLK